MKVESVLLAVIVAVAVLLAVPSWFVYLMVTVDVTFEPVTATKYIWTLPALPLIVGVPVSVCRAVELLLIPG